ncbi:MAG: MDR/zinc-dependent alcohol dehydrogenase-like family protein [bacterium]|jgi:threonine dehydrogenase-like Zn-dependent dehydrogenase
MLAVHLERGVVELRDVPEPVPPAGFALIRLVCAGICNTDLELQRGYYDFAGIPGHEFVGVVERGPGELIGKRVVGEINLACGACEWCARGLGRHCERRTVLGIAGHPGAFAEYLTLPAANLHAIPDGLTDERAVFAEPLAAACEILDQVEIPRGALVAVLGDGKLGLLTAQVLAAHGANVRLYGHHPERAVIARVEPGRAGDTFDWVVEATGSAEGLVQAVAMTRPRGTIVMKSTVHGDVALDMAPVIVNEITLVGSRCGRFEPALALLERGAVRVDEMITERYALRDAPRAFARAAQRGALKVLLYP